MSFCTAVNCIDGRVQLPLIRYLQEGFGVLYVARPAGLGPLEKAAPPWILMVRCAHASLCVDLRTLALGKTHVCSRRDYCALCM